MSMPRTWYLPCSTFSLTTKWLKLRKTWKSCLLFHIKKCIGITGWMSGYQVLIYSMAEPLHHTLKELLRERSTKRWSPFPVFRGRSSDVSLHKVLKYVPWPRQGEGKWKHSLATAAPKLSPRACCLLQVNVDCLPMAYMDNLDIQTGAMRGRLKKVVQGLVLENLKLPSCPNPISHL